MVRSIEQEIRDLHELFGSSRDPEGLAFVPLADAYRRSGDTTRALVLLTDGRARHPDLPAAALVEGLVRRDLGDADGAEEAFRRVLELDPDNARALVGLGRVLTERRADDPEGETMLRRGLTLDPGLADEETRPEPAPGTPPPEAAPLPSADDGLVAPADLAPSGFDGGAATVEETFVEEAFQGEVGLEAFDFSDESGGGFEDGEAEAGIELEVPDPAEGEGWPTEELHIQWDAEAAFEPFDGGLYGGSETFGGDAALDGTTGAVFDEEAEAEVADGGEATAAEAVPDVEGPPEVGALPTGDVAPEELLMELNDLAPDLEPGVLPAEEDDEEEVLPTRTLAELYARQGLLAEAVQVYEDLVQRSPDDWGLQARLEELQSEMSGGKRGAAAGESTPAGPRVREFLGRLLAWQPGDGSAGPDVG